MTAFQILFVLCASLACLAATEIEYDMDHRCTKYHGDPNIVLCPRPTEKEVLLKGQARGTIFDFLAKDMHLIIDSKKTPNLRIIKILNGQCPSIKSNRIIQIENSDSACKVRPPPHPHKNKKASQFEIISLIC